jgi:hypothetical protein
MPARVPPTWSLLRPHTGLARALLCPAPVRAPRYARTRVDLAAPARSRRCSRTAAGHRAPAGRNPSSGSRYHTGFGESLTVCVQHTHTLSIHFFSFLHVSPLTMYYFHQQFAYKESLDELQANGRGKRIDSAKPRVAAY